MSPMPSSVRVLPSFYMAFELLRQDARESILMPGVKPEPYEEGKNYSLRSYVPPANTPLGMYFHRAIGKPVGISVLQPADSPRVSSNGLLASAVLVTHETPPMRVWNAPERVYELAGVSYGDGEPLFASLKPCPRLRNENARIFETVVHFLTGHEEDNIECVMSKLSRVPGPGELNIGSMYLSPLTADDEIFLDILVGNGFQNDALAALAEIAPPEKEHFSNLFKVEPLPAPSAQPQKVLPGRKALPGPSGEAEGKVVQLPRSAF